MEVLTLIAIILIVIAVATVKVIQYIKMDSKPKTIMIKRKGRDTLVKSVKVKDLDVSKCSKKFLSHSFDGEKMVYVKCDVDGNFLYRPKKSNGVEYVLLKADDIK